MYILQSIRGDYYLHDLEMFTNRNKYIPNTIRKSLKQTTRLWANTNRDDPVAFLHIITTKTLPIIISITMTHKDIAEI